MENHVMKDSPKYVRIWRGQTTRAKADEYQAYWLKTGTRPLVERGALSVHMLREDLDETAKFVTIYYWSSLEAMTGNSGGDPRATHHLPRDAEFLIDLPDRVEILNVLDSTG